MKNLDANRYRYERKFAVTDCCRAEVEQLIKLHSACFGEIFQQRTINNVYFDTANNRHLRDSVDGATHRLKVRVRWYGELFDLVQQPVLELKWKHGLMVTKDSFSVEPFELSRGMNFDHLDRLVRNADVPDTLRYETHCIKPVLVNSYDRKYFLSADKRFRVTIDDRLGYYRVRQFANHFLNRTEHDRHVIVEIKYGPTHDVDADRISREFPFRLSRWSKFVAGLEQDYAG